MAEELPQSVEGVEQPAPAQGMEVDTEAALDAVTTDEQPNGAEKRRREDGDGDPVIAKEEEEGASKKQKVETSAEEERMEKLEEKEGDEKEGDVAKESSSAAAKVSIGTKEFGSSEELFNYFFKFLHFWTPNLDVNKYEHIMLLDLLKKGHAEPDKKIGGGIRAFQIRYHPTWKSRCFFLVRVDGSSDDFSFRKCVDHILPLPEHLKGQSGSVGGKEHDGKKGGGRGWGGGRGRGGGGRGGRGRGRRGGR